LAYLSTTSKPITESTNYLIQEKANILMGKNTSSNTNTWQEDKDDIIILANRSSKNYVLDLPAGRCRLDAGRRMRTLRSILKISQVKELLQQGSLVIEN
jgi:hypothetical protein